MKNQNAESRFNNHIYSIVKISLLKRFIMNKDNNYF